MENTLDDNQRRLDIEEFNKHLTPPDVEYINAGIHFGYWKVVGGVSFMRKFENGYSASTQVFISDEEIKVIISTGSKRRNNMAYLTPAEINVLIHYHVYPRDHPLISSQTVKNAINRFIKADLMREDTKDLTNRGRALIKMLCDTPMPIASWSDPREDG